MFHDDNSKYGRTVVTTGQKTTARRTCLCQVLHHKDWIKLQKYSNRRLSMKTKNRKDVKTLFYPKKKDVFDDNKLHQVSLSWCSQWSLTTVQKNRPELHWITIKNILDDFKRTKSYKEELPVHRWSYPSRSGKNANYNQHRSACLQGSRTT